MIIQEEDLNKLLSTWKSRAENKVQPEDYKCAVKECIYDLRNLINKAKDEEEVINEILANYPTEKDKEFFYALEADEYPPVTNKHTA